MFEAFSLDALHAIVVQKETAAWDAIIASHAAVGTSEYEVLASRSDALHLAFKNASREYAQRVQAYERETYTALIKALKRR